MRFIFDAYVAGKRLRERVVCRRTERHIKYHEWVERLREERTGTFTMLFENFQKYLHDYARVHR